MNNDLGKTNSKLITFLDGTFTPELVLNNVIGTLTAPDNSTAKTKRLYIVMLRNETSSNINVKTPNTEISILYNINRTTALNIEKIWFAILAANSSTGLTLEKIIQIVFSEETLIFST